MRLKILLILLTSLLIFQTSLALKIDIQGDLIVGSKLEISTDKPALIVLRINNGTPIYAYGNATFTPRVAGILSIEAIAGNERAFRVIEIQQPTVPSGGGGGYTGEYYLPSGSTQITLEDGSKCEINWRTALGALIRASEVKGFGVVVKKWSYGLYVKCIGGICEKSLGLTSGWMYQVNGEIPMVSADQYDLSAGDTLIWYFSRSMSETSETSPYKIRVEIYDDWSFDIYISPSMPWQLPSEGEVEGGGGGISATPTTTPTPTQQVVVNETNESIAVVFRGNVTLSVPERIANVTLNLRSSEDTYVEIVKSKLTGVIYGYVLDCFEIRSNKTLSGNITFRVSKDWIKAHNATPLQVVLMKRVNRDWIDLPTNLIGENESYYFYQSNVSNFSVFATVLKWKGFPLKRNDTAIVKALKYLRSVQRDDGGFGSIANTSWVLMALVCAGENPYNWTKNGSNPIDYLRKNLNRSSIEKMGTSDFERIIITLVAIGENPYDFNGIDFVEELKKRLKPDGQIGDYIYTTIWGILALKACGENVSKSVEWLKKQQNSDGGFAWAVGELSDYDDTAAAIQALIAGGISRDDSVVVKALKYLKTGQCSDGGMRYFGTSCSNSASDSWTIQALVASGINPMDWKTNNTSVVEHLLSLQDEDGHFKYTKYITSNPIYMTASAVIALLGKPQPIKVNESLKKVTTPEVTPTTTTTAKAVVKTTTTAIVKRTEERRIPGGFAVLAMTALFVAYLVYRFRR